MDTEKETSSKSPPYLAYATFKNFLSSVGKGVIPKVVNKHLIVGQSGSNQTYILSALKFFGLIDANGIPQSEFQTLVKAEGDERKRVWKAIFTKGYASLIHDLDLADATPGLLNQRYADQGLTGATLRKCHSFFISAAEDAGISLAPGLKPTRGAKVGRPRKARSGKQNGNGGDDLPQQQTTGPKTMQEILLAKFPEFNPEWDAELQVKWFAGFEKLMAASLDDPK